MQNKFWKLFAFYRSRKWVQNTRREDLMKKDTEDLYRNNRICGKHFEDNQFMSAAEKNSLVWNAVPTIFDVPNPPPSVTPSRKRPANRTNDRPAKICKGMCVAYIYIYNIYIYWYYTGFLTFWKPVFYLENVYPSGPSPRYHAFIHHSILCL